MTGANVAERLRARFEALAEPTDAAIDALLSDYADDVVFRDPYQVVHGKSDVREVFRRMLRSARSIRIETRDLVASSDLVWLAWRFALAPRRGPTIDFDGATAFRLRDERVVLHRDYWDTVETIRASAAALVRPRGTG